MDKNLNRYRKLERICEKRGKKEKEEESYLVRSSWLRLNGFIYKVF